MPLCDDNIYVKALGEPRWPSSPASSLMASSKRDLAAHPDVEHIPHTVLSVVSLAGSGCASSLEQTREMLVFLYPNHVRTVTCFFFTIL